MQHSNHLIDQRDFSRATAAVTGGIAGLGLFPLTGWGAGLPGWVEEDNLNIIGPRAGYAPQIGALVSMMTWMRGSVLMSLKDLSQADLDYLHDSSANSIGAMLMHLAATERFYQIHTFEGRKWGDWEEQDIRQWRVASELGEAARREIRGHDLRYYLDLLRTVRGHTLEEFRKRDDEWLLSVDKKWYWGPTNNYCKWFHVCEHESNHNGQIRWVRSRLPGAG